MKKFLTMMICVIMVLCTACANSDGEKDEAFSRNFEYDFEGKYWISENNEGFYFNGQQYLFLEDGELSTGAYVVYEDEIRISEDIYSYSKDEWNKSYDIGNFLFEISENTLKLYFDLDDGGNATNDGVIYEETTKEKFEELSGISIEFSSLSTNTYWLKKARFEMEHKDVLYFDESSIERYNSGMTAVHEQKYSADNNVIFLEPTLTITMDSEEVGTIQHSGGLEQKYSIINDVMVINIDASNGEVVTTTDLVFYTLIDKKTTEEIIDKK